jgi:alpha 1,2-mannosyltransferase
MCRFNSGVRAVVPCDAYGSSDASLFTQFFYRHELLKPYRWYWRVEYVRVPKAWTSAAHLAYARPDVDFTCDIQYDPFVFMEQNNKTYGALCFLVRTITLSHPRSGWTITLTEVMDTIPGLWEATKGKEFGFAFFPS